MCLFFPLFVLYWEMESRLTSFFNARWGFLKGGGFYFVFEMYMWLYGEKLIFFKVGKRAAWPLLLHLLKTIEI